MPPGYPLYRNDDNNAVPCQSILINHHVGNQSQCPDCIDGAEDLLHMLFQCARSQAVWEALGIAAYINFASITDRAGSVVLEFILCDESCWRHYSSVVELPELISTFCWFLWWQRRQYVRGEVILYAERTAMAMVALTINYGRGSQAKTTPRPIHGHYTWQVS
uniref:Reverse transcriptase zinc-binding domain-containing protein n=1 Tax=Hordeum vulgare subsp. vulgare TaxID=112509 RepID=A0A8I6WJK5_HORVV